MYFRFTESLVLAGRIMGPHFCALEYIAANFIQIGCLTLEAWVSQLQAAARAVECVAAGSRGEG